MMLLYCEFEGEFWAVYSSEAKRSPISRVHTQTKSPFGKRRENIVYILNTIFMTDNGVSSIIGFRHFACDRVTEHP